MEPLEARIKKLEERLSAVESKTAAAAKPVSRPAQPQPGEEPVIIEGGGMKTLDDVKERVQELEDLLLLIELENTKLRESVAGGKGAVLPDVTPDIAERLNRIEEQLASARPGGDDEKISRLEEKIARLESAPRITTRAEKVTVTKKPKAEEDESGILEEIQMILNK